MHHSQNKTILEVFTLFSFLPKSKKMPQLCLHEFGSMDDVM